MASIKDQIKKIIQKLATIADQSLALFKIRATEGKVESKNSHKSDDRLTDWEKKVLERKEKTTEAKKAWENKRMQLSRETHEEPQ